MHPDSPFPHLPSCNQHRRSHDNEKRSDEVGEEFGGEDDGKSKEETKSAAEDQ